MLDLALAPLRSGLSLALVPVGLAIGTLQRGVATTLTPTSFSTINNDISNHAISSSANVTEVVVGVVTSGACVRLFRMVDELGLGLGLGPGQGPAVVLDAHLPPPPTPSSLHNCLAGQEEEEGGQEYALTEWRALRRSIERVGVGYGRGGRLLVPYPPPSNSLPFSPEQLTVTKATMTTTQLLLPSMPPSMQLLLDKRGGGGSGGWTPLSVLRALAHTLTHPHHSSSLATVAGFKSPTNIHHADTMSKTSPYGYGRDHFGIAPAPELGLAPGLVYTVDTPLTAMFAYTGLLTPPPFPPPPSSLNTNTELNQSRATSATTAASISAPVLALAVRLQGVLDYVLSFTIGDKQIGLGLGLGQEAAAAKGGGRQKGREGGGDGLRQALALACVRLRHVAMTVVGAGSIGDLLQTQGLGPGLGAGPLSSGHDGANGGAIDGTGGAGGHDNGSDDDGDGDGEEVIFPFVGVEDMVGVYVLAESVRRLLEWADQHQGMVIATNTGLGPGLRTGPGSMSGLGLGLSVGISPTTAGGVGVSDGDNSTCSSSSSSSSSSSLVVMMLVSRLLWKVLGSEASSSSSSSSSSTSLRNSPGAGLGQGLGFGFGRLGGSSSGGGSGSSGDVNAVVDVSSGSGFAVEACLSAVLASVLQDLSQSSSLGHCNTESNNGAYPGANPGPNPGPSPNPNPSPGRLSAVAVSHCLLASVREQQALFQTLVYAPLVALLPQVHISIPYRAHYITLDSLS